MVLALRWLLLAAFAAAVGLGVPILWHRHNAAQQAIGYDRRAAEDSAAAQAQTGRNRELQRASELRYVLAAAAREKFIVTTIREIHDEAAHLADCRVPDAVRVRLNAAARCARDDTGAACAADDGVPGTR